MTKIDSTLDERGKKYGEFKDHAALSQQFKLAMQSAGQHWYRLDDDMREALEMIQHKIARIINGDPTHIDSWHDIQGYARLIEHRLIREKEDRKADTMPLDIDLE